MLHRQIWNYQTSLEATHGYQSRPSEWFFNQRPVWFYVEYGEDTIANIYALSNPVLAGLGVLAVTASAIATYVYVIMRVVAHESAKKLLHFPRFITHPTALLFVFISYLMVWLPWQLSPRIMFFYHYTPAIPLLSIIIAYWLYNIQDLIIKNYRVGATISVTAILLLVTAFGIWFPHWTAIPVSKELANQVYFVFDSWK